MYPVQIETNEDNGDQEENDDDNNEELPPPRCSEQILTITENGNK